MTLNQLRAFLEAARHGSITAAARVLGVSQASVSELIKRLEDEHDVQLFIRGRRRLALTSAGEALLDHAEAAINAAEGADRALRSVKTLSGGVATFGMLRNADYYLLSGLIHTFVQTHPSVRIRIVGLNSVDVAAGVAEGTLEAGLVVLPIDATGLRVTPLARDEVMYVSGDPERVRGAVSIETLAERPLVLYDAQVGAHDPTRRQLADRANMAGVALEARVEVEFVQTALNLVARGVGDTIASRAVLRTYASTLGLHGTPLDPPMFDTIALVRRESVPLSAATREIIALARSMLQDRAPAGRPGARPAGASVP